MQGRKADLFWARRFESPKKNGKNVLRKAFLVNMAKMDTHRFLHYYFSMPVLQERHSKRFHITLQVSNLGRSIRDYSEILGSAPCWVVPGRLALWRTGDVNFLLRADSRQRTSVLQLGWEFDYLENTQRFKDCNQLSWLFFSTGAQNSAIHRLKHTAYDEQSDFPLELGNPDARRHFWSFGSLGASLLLLLSMLVFTFWNNGYLKAFFEFTETDYAGDIYSNSGLLHSAGSLLEAAGYAVSYDTDYGVARHPKQAEIMFQIVNQQILFRTYWALPKKFPQKLELPVETGASGESEVRINAINREAVLCRYYLDEEGDVAIEAYFGLPPLLLQNGPNDTAPELSLARQQAALQWQKILSLWQQESLSWIENSLLFGGSLEPGRSFHKK